jgi:peptidoglycan/xylan/chitin deacetylase (PgdA/CDA1 family)
MRAILTYHAIDDTGSPISCHPDAFERHLDWLRSGPVRATTIEELVALPASADAVAITFDDALVTFGDVAAPRLLDRGLPCTVFVVADCAGGTNDWGGRLARGVPRLPVLEWPALARLQEQGIAIGSHTRTHPDLTKLDARALEDEIRGSADVIARETGRRPAAFAYPYGRVDARVAAAAAVVYRVACTTELRPFGDLEDRVRLPRLDAYYFQKAGTLEAWGSPAFHRFITRRARLRRLREAGRAAWRSVGTRQVPS